MVRINIINPKKLTDQHLIAEYNEILMLFGYVKKYPSIKKNIIPKKYVLGKGHILFFKNKLLYLKQRHERIKKEMKKRGFSATKTIILKKYPLSLQQSWKPEKGDTKIIIKRLAEKIKKKKRWYRYHGAARSQKFFLGLLK
jgi:deoxyribonuclease (pyrimidine dimer)